MGCVWFWWFWWLECARAWDARWLISGRSANVWMRRGWGARTCATNLAEVFSSLLEARTDKSLICEIATRPLIPLHIQTSQTIKLHTISIPKWDTI